MRELLNQGVQIEGTWRNVQRPGERAQLANERRGLACSVADRRQITIEFVV
jgi:hypothetical protein